MAYCISLDITQYILWKVSGTKIFTTGLSSAIILDPDPEIDKFIFSIHFPLGYPISITFVNLRYDKKECRGSLVIRLLNT